MRIANTPPPHCSSCFGPHVDRRHVDFESAWDGPTFGTDIATGDGKPVRNLTVTIDDLVICEKCVEEAAGLVGLIRADELVEENVAQLEQLDNLRDRLADREDYIAKLERAVAAKPKAPQRKKVAA